MKSDFFCLAITATSWFIFCGMTTTVITKGAVNQDGLMVLCTLFFSPALFSPLSRFMLLFRKKKFVLMRKKSRMWLHLNPWITIGQPGLGDISDYWHALIEALNTGLETSRYTLVLSSHLLSHKRTARLVRCFPAGQYQFRTLRRPVSRVERTGLQVETLLREWRWFSPAMHCGVLVIRKKQRGY